MHPLLARQLRRLGLRADATPTDAAGWLALLDRVSDTYDDFDRERYMMERSISISSAEMRTLYDDLVADVAERKRAEAALRESEAAQRLLFDASPVPVIIFDEDTFQLVGANEAAARLYGYTREQLLARTMLDLHPPAQRADAVATVRGSVGEWRGAKVHVRADGTPLQVEIVARTLTLSGVTTRLAVISDVTTRIELEAQLRQSQKMEAVGRLAGGVAHDFNNILSVILGYADITVEALSADSDAREYVDEIRTAGTRASDLTRQLLLFSRHQMVEQRVLDLNDVLSRTERMLKRLVGADIQLVTRLAPSLGAVRADPGNLEQVLVNLVVNARDAMPTGGTLTIATRDEALDERYASAHPGAAAGPHVVISVTDTGCGMDKATMSRIFEPFFTTKAQNKGTGLGLSTVFGIVRQSRGTITVQSEPGRGATFTIYLPRVEAAVTAPSQPPPSLELHGAETILLVEDEEQVREVAIAILSRAGYRVLAARDGEEALRRSAEHAGAIDLLLTDVVMPGMSGPELVRRLSPTRPETAILCMSGYTDETINRHGVPDLGVSYLQKPFTSASLTRRVRETLDAAHEARRAAP